MIELGATYKDKVTGFTGVATGYVKYLTGCNQALICPKAGKGEPQWLDDSRLDRVGNAVIRLNKTGNDGFDRAPPIR